MTTEEAPPADYRFNKLRKTGGSHRLTLVKTAVREADLDPGPPRPVLAHIPAANGTWVAFHIRRYPSQQRRVRLRQAVTDELAANQPIVGEYPVELRGKLGSAITLVPKQLVDAVDIRTRDQVTTIAIAPEAVLFISEGATDAAGDRLRSAIDTARKMATE